MSIISNLVMLLFTLVVAFVVLLSLVDIMSSLGMGGCLIVGALAVAYKLGKGSNHS